MRAFQAWSRFDGARLRPWLLRILKNEFLGRKRYHKDNRTFIHDEGIEPFQDDLWMTVISRVQANNILLKLDELEPHYRLAVQLCDVEGLSYEDASEAMEIPVGTVRSRLFRGRNRLRELLSQDFAEEDAT